MTGLKKRKRALADAISGADARLGELLTPEDVEALFAPMAEPA
jgi:hypothetical protein